MACSKISYLTASEMSTNLLSLHYSGFSVFCTYFYIFHRWEAACWKCKIKRFCVPDTEWQGLGHSQFLAALYSQITKPRSSCKWSVTFANRLWFSHSRTRAAVPASIACTPVTRAHASQPWPTVNQPPHNTYTHTQLFICLLCKLYQGINSYWK